MSIARVVEITQAVSSSFGRTTNFNSCIEGEVVSPNQRFLCAFVLARVDDAIAYHRVKLFAEIAVFSLSPH
jgi:hypothetical protein